MWKWQLYIALIGLALQNFLWIANGGILKSNLVYHVGAWFLWSAFCGWKTLRSLDK